MCYAKHPFMDQSALAIINASYTFPNKAGVSEKMQDLIRWLLIPDPRERPNICNVLSTLSNWDDPNMRINLPQSAL